MQGFRITKTAKVFLRAFIIRNPYMLFSSSFSSPYKKNIALCKEATSFERRECFASSYANISHASVRRSCTARCEGLAWLHANVSHRLMRMSRMPRCERFACLDARLSKSLFFLVFLFCPLH